MGINYINDDAQSLTNFEDATFDGVVCNLALMDIQDFKRTFQTVHRVLCKNGWFVFSISHPCLYPSGLTRISDMDGKAKSEIVSYFTEVYWRSDNPNGVRGQVGAFHRTLSTYLNSLVEAGLTLERFVEPQATGKVAEIFQGIKRYQLF